MNNHRIFHYLLDVLPLHAEEGHIREDLAESELVSVIQANSDDSIVAETVVATMRRLFESLALLDPTALAAGRWAFVSFPASLMARSILETMATGNTFFAPSYWIQGGHQRDEIVEEQRALLTRLENQRTADSASARPIRTVHVTWGIIRFGSKFLLHRREDKLRTDVKGHVFPGGRMDMTDLPKVMQNQAALRNLFSIDSSLAKEAQTRTLFRELNEELQLLQNDYDATYQRTLDPYSKVEGTRNNHSFTQYNIAIYSVKLNQTGVLKVLDRIVHEPDKWGWFTTSELVTGKRSDGKSAFIDVLIQAPLIEIEKFLSNDNFSDSTTTLYRTKSDAVALPSAIGKPVLRGDAGRQKSVRLSLVQSEWELLMILGWYLRSLEVIVHDGLMADLGGGWIQLGNEELMETAKRLAQKLDSCGLLRLVECDSRGYCRLSIDAEHLYFQPECFQYLWDIESEDKPVLLTLKGIETRWAALKEQEITIRLSPTIVNAMPDMQKGREPERLDTVLREFNRLLEPARASGLHQFFAKRNGAFEILVMDMNPHSE